jgi:hypothetical protein
MYLKGTERQAVNTIHIRITQMVQGAAQGTESQYGHGEPIAFFITQKNCWDHCSIANNQQKYLFKEYILLLNIKLSNKQHNKQRHKLITCPIKPMNGMANSSQCSPAYGYLHI